MGEGERENEREERKPRGGLGGGKDSCLKHTCLLIAPANEWWLQITFNWQDTGLQNYLPANNPEFHAKVSQGRAQSSEHSLQSLRGECTPVEEAAAVCGVVRQAVRPRLARTRNLRAGQTCTPQSDMRSSGFTFPKRTCHSVWMRPLVGI